MNFITDYRRGTHEAREQELLEHANLNREDGSTILNYALYVAEFQNSEPVTVLECYPMSETPYLFSDCKVEAESKQLIEQYTFLKIKEGK